MVLIGPMVQLFEYSKLVLQLERSCKLFNGLDDFEVTLYVCPNHTDDDLHSDHSYLDTLEIPLNSALIPKYQFNSDVLTAWLNNSITKGYSIWAPKEKVESKILSNPLTYLYFHTHSYFFKF